MPSLAPLGETQRRELEQRLLAHEPRLLALALKLCADAQDARDLVQDTLERALRSADPPPTDGRTRVWLNTILQNLFIDRCRRLRTSSPHEPLDEQVAQSLAAPHEPEPDWASITREQVEAALGRLNEDFRRVYQLHSLEGRSYEEISRELKIPRATVGTRLLRARQRLRQLLSPLLPGQEASE